MSYSAHVLLINRSKIHLHVEQLSPEYLQNAGRRPQTSKRTSKSPSNWVGQKKERKKGGQDLCTWDGAVKKEKFQNSEDLHWQGDQLGQKGSFRASEESAATSVQRAKQGKPCRDRRRPHPPLSNPRRLPFC